MRSRTLKIFAMPVIAVYITWTIYMIVTNSWKLFYHYFFMSITMIFGSFVAGGSAEGGGAVAFPVMTLIFKIHPADARNFSLAIQSIGMTAATLWIIARKIRIEKTYLTLAFIGATAGIIFSTYFIAPFTPPAYAKMLFVSFWLSFGIALFVVNYYRRRNICEQLPDLSHYQQAELIAIGFIGGILSAIFGSGIDICTFAFITMKYNLSEKVATPTSVVLMASNAIIGFLLHQFIIADVAPVVYNYWLVCIPVVMLGAPFGALVVSKAKRLHIVNFLCAVILIQFVGAIFIIKPSGRLLWFSAGGFLIGMIVFFLLTLRNKTPLNVPDQLSEVNADD
ncbi:sulfite exporter TauE/SafE family protein [Mucilaginibacter segetis]|uniref:Probable membrane transporter protein n=1 Tax=Mucilaginibacter segetis TaxID=2793071 RepID=A0A934PPN2_9SPHI|nr:sulfite exporter TauE/SafE family protein [Mucilaginibacter segetis]MBK0378424.1 sulfite exporter TauE/SafE family protein [Mucilaginibacter segetis]